MKGMAVIEKRAYLVSTKGKREREGGKGTWFLRRHSEDDDDPLGEADRS